MAYLPPRNQVRNMLDIEISQSLLGGPTGGNANLGKIVALSSLLHQPQAPHQVTDNWLDDNWLNDI